MPRNRASFFKRQREVAKKQKREEKFQRKLEKKTAPASVEPTQLPEPEAVEESGQPL